MFLTTMYHGISSTRSLEGKESTEKENEKERERVTEEKVGEEQAPRLQYRREDGTAKKQNILSVCCKDAGNESRDARLIQWLAERLSSEKLSCVCVCV